MAPSPPQLRAEHAAPNSPRRNLPQDLQQAVLPVLVRLLGEAGVAEDVPGALGQLVANNAELQQAAADADAIAKLGAILRCGGCWMAGAPSASAVVQPLASCTS